MDGLIGNYGGVSDEEEQEDEESMEYEERSSEPKQSEGEEEEDERSRLTGEIEASPTQHTLPDYPDSPPPPDIAPPLPPLLPLPNPALPGLASYTSQSPGRSAPAKTALTSLLASYDEVDKSLLEEKDEEDIEKQYDVTVENSDSDSDTENFMGKIDEDGNPKIPQEPKGKVSSKLQDQINVLLEKKRKGYDFCRKMKMNKQFRNPSIYDKLIDMIGIQETGTNFTDPIFNKNQWKTESFYKQLADKQQKEYDKKEAERKKERENDPNAKIKQMVIADKEKRTKWDAKDEAKDKLMKANAIKERLNKDLAMRAKNS